MPSATGTGPTPPSTGQPAVIPPVVLYLPSISEKQENTSTRIADIIADELTKGPGTFSVSSLDHKSEALTDGRRILNAQGTPVVDFHTVAYRDRLPKVKTDADTTGAAALVKLLLRQIWYFVRALALFVGAGKRAKSPMAKLQLVYGFGAVLVLVLGIALTVVAILVAVGVIDAADVNSTWADIVAIGLTAVVTWALAKSAPTIRRAGVLVHQLLDYAQDSRQAVTVVNSLGEAMDGALEEHTDREVYLLGYSLGSLVAIDYLCPRKSQLQYIDRRENAAVRGLITIGSPLDFVRLYISDYIDGRVSRVDNLRWINVFIPADVLGSNMVDGDDAAIPTAETVVRTGGIAPTETVPYTNETLTWKGIFQRRGFFSHGGYWGLPKEGNCLNVVITTVLPALRP